MFVRVPVLVGVLVGVLLDGVVGVGVEVVEGTPEVIAADTHVRQIYLGDRGGK